MDYTEDSAIGDLVATVLDGVNEYQSRASGADIAYKMGQKIIRGGSVSRAPIGYLSVRETFEGREVRTIAVDPVRGPLIRSAFELYASGAYTVRTLIQALTDAGLRTKPTYRYPNGTTLSIHALGKLLSDRYYLGLVEYRGQEYPGRHEPLVTPEIFDRVQQVTESRRTGGGRERVHNHYLKGAVWCARRQRRLMVMRGKSKTGHLHFYYFCRGRQLHDCDLPHQGRSRHPRRLRHGGATGLPEASDHRARRRSARQERRDSSPDPRPRRELNKRPQYERRSLRPERRSRLAARQGSPLGPRRVPGRRGEATFQPTLNCVSGAGVPLSKPHSGLALRMGGGGGNAVAKPPSGPLPGEGEWRQRGCGWRSPRLARPKAEQNKTRLDRSTLSVDTLQPQSRGAADRLLEPDGADTTPTSHARTAEPPALPY
jgi:hypothetical protein